MKKNVEEYLAYKRGETRMPDHLRVRREPTGPLFKNPFMERLTRTGIFTPIVMHIAINSFLFWYGIARVGINLKTGIFLFAGGFFFWTFAEYIVHRFLYHTETNSGLLFSIQHSAHGIHHQHPKDPTRLAMPPVPAIFASGLFFLVFWLVMRNYVFTFFPGFIIGYLVYISMHYAQHRIIMPKYPPLKKLWQHHIVHHYKDPYSAYGVSTRLWDFVFGTMPEEDSRKKE